MPTLVAGRNVLKYLYANGFGPENDDSVMMKVTREFSHPSFSLRDFFPDIEVDLRGDPKNLKNSPVIRALVKEELIDMGHKRRIIERNRQKGILEYVDPLANISHLVSVPCRISLQIFGAESSSMKFDVTTKQQPL
jgi:hypothetical protein